MRTLWTLVIGALLVLVLLSIGAVVTKQGRIGNVDVCKVWSIFLDIGGEPAARAIWRGVFRDICPNNWLIFEGQLNVVGYDDVPYLLHISPAVQGSGAWSRVGLSVRCSEPFGVDVTLLAEETYPSLSRDYEAISVKFDNEEIGKIWTFYPDREERMTALFAHPYDVQAFLKKMMQSNTLSVEWFDRNGDLNSARFDIGGLASLLDSEPLCGEHR